MQIKDIMKRAKAAVAGKLDPDDLAYSEREFKREIYRQVGYEFFDEARRLRDEGKDMCAYCRLLYALAAIGYTERTKQKRVPLRHLQDIAGCSRKEVLEMMEFFIKFDYVRKFIGGYGVAKKMAEFLREFLFGYPDFFEDMMYGA